MTGHTIDSTTRQLIFIVFVAIGAAAGGLVLGVLAFRYPDLLLQDRPAPPPPPPTLAQQALELTSSPPMRAVETVAAAPTPHWIWATSSPGGDDRVWFRRRISFERTPAGVELRLSSDNHGIVRVADREIARCDDWQQPVTVELTPPEDGGDLELTVEAWNEGGPAGMIAVVEVTHDDGSTRSIITDESWETSADESFAATTSAAELGELGTAPWGALAAIASIDVDRSIRVREGFDVDLVYTVPGDQGSWVSLTVDAKGRLITSDQYGSLYRITPGETTEDTVVEKVELTAGGAQGLLCVDDDLYCVINTKAAEGHGLYRIRDTDGDDEYDDLELLRAIPCNGGEHGVHGVVLGQDGLLYVVAGNHVPLPESFEKSAVPRVWDEDHLLPRLWDARGHAVGVLAPGGWIARTDLDGKSWELVCIGFRNTYDIAFNDDGELFAYDADMEWDMGAPWYRPTRINHVVSGAEFGWRSGTGKWPTHYPDSLPAVVDIGPGSPTGVAFGYETNFPDRYRRAMFILDWTFGTMYAVHMEPDGASYRGTHEPFVTGQPLPLTDVVANPSDGALYFTVGGRRIASAMYRVRYTGDATAPAAVADAGAADRERRRALEKWHGPDAPDEAIDEAWAALADEDRHVRYAARTVLEHQDPSRWASRATGESDRRARLTALLGLIRIDAATHRQAIVDALLEYRWYDLPRTEQLEVLRCWALLFIRSGPPDETLATTLITEYGPMFPRDDDAIDRELCDLLVYLGAPTVVARAVARMERVDTAQDEIDRDLLLRSDQYGQVILKMAAAQPQRQQIHYALSLRNAEVGWTPELRRRYFTWFQTAKKTVGGMSFVGFLDRIRDDALARIPEDERAAYEQIDPLAIAGVDPETYPRGPGRSWTVDNVLTLVEGGLAHRDFDRGRQLYAGAMCLQCHRLAGEGQPGGPDLSGIGSRFSLRDLIETIVEPSRVISDQYRNEELVLDDGRVLIGRVVNDDGETLQLMQSMLAPSHTTPVEHARIAERRPSDVSPMQPYLLDSLAPGEVLDLLAYVLAGGDPRAEMFQPAGASEFVSLFDGETLDGWEGDDAFWSVEEGVIVGRTTADSLAPHNTFLIHDDDLPDSFELRGQVWLRGDNNSGIQYHSTVRDDYRVTGYQCDIHPNPPYNGMLYEEGGRGIMIQADASVEFGHRTWRDYSVIVRGNRVEHRIDGTVRCVLVDEEGTPGGVGRRLALQVHAGAPYEVRFRNVRLRALADE